MPDCETETFFAASETFGGVKPLDPCNPSTERIPDELREPTGDLTPSDQPEIPDPIKVWNCAMGLSCADKYPGDDDVYGDNNLAVDDNVTSESIQLTAYSIPQRILTYIALRIDLKALARTIHDACRDLVDVYEYKGEDKEEHMADVRARIREDVQHILMTNAGIPESDARSAANDFVLAQERQNRIAHRQMEGGLICYWLNKKQTATCDEIHDSLDHPKPWATQADYDLAAPLAITSALTVRSEVSQADADEKAKQMAIEALNCLFVNDYQKAECWEKFGYESEESAIEAGYEVVQTDDGPSFAPTRPPRLNFADVGPGAIVSYESKEDANRQAKALALSRLSCYYINDPVDLACALSYARFYGEDPATVTRHVADVVKKTPGQDVYVPKAMFVVETNTADANRMARELAEPLLDCCYVSAPREEVCPLYVVVYEDGHFVVKDNPGAGDEYYVVAPSETASEVLSVAVDVGQYAECLVTLVDKTSKEKSLALQQRLDELARNTARASLVCAYCNVEIPPTCVPADVTRLISVGETLPGDIRLASPTWVKEVTEDGTTRVLKTRGTVLEAGTHYQLALPLPEIITLADGSYDDRTGWSLDATNGIQEGLYCGEIEYWDSIHHLASTAAITERDEGDETCRYENKDTVFYCNEGEWNLEDLDLDPVPGDTALAQFVNTRTLHPKFKYLRKTNKDDATPELIAIRAGHTTKGSYTYRTHTFVGGVWDKPLQEPECPGCKGKETFYGTKTDTLDTYFIAHDSYQGLAYESNPTPGTYVMIPRGTITMTAEMLDATKDNYRLNKDGSKNYDNPFNNRVVADAVREATKAMGIAMLDCFFVNHTAWTLCEIDGGEDTTRTDLATAEEWVLPGPHCPPKKCCAGNQGGGDPDAPICYPAPTGGGSGGSSDPDCDCAICGGSTKKSGSAKAYSWGSQEKIIIPRGTFKSYNSLEETYEQCLALAAASAICAYRLKIQPYICERPCYYVCDNNKHRPKGLPVPLPPIYCSSTHYMYVGCESSEVITPCKLPPWPCFWKNSKVIMECWPGFGYVEVPEGMFISYDCHTCQEAAIMLAQSMLNCNIGLCYKIREVKVECPDEFVPLHHWSAGYSALFKTEMHMCGWSSYSAAYSGMMTLAQMIYGGCLPKHIYSARYCNETLYSEVCDKLGCVAGTQGQPKQGYGTVVVEEGTLCGYSSVEAANEAATAMAKATRCYCNYTVHTQANTKEYSCWSCLEAGYTGTRNYGAGYTGEWVLDRGAYVYPGYLSQSFLVRQDENGILNEEDLRDAEAEVNKLAYSTALGMTICSYYSYTNGAAKSGPSQDWFPS